MVLVAFVALVSAAVVALVSVAFVAFAQKDAHDHAIWTVAAVSHPVVTDHHHRHSLELVSVEAPVIEIVVVVAHAMHFQFLLFLSHQRLEELGANLVAVQANLEVQEAPEVCQEDQEEHQDHGRRSILVVMESWSHLLLRFSGVISRC